MADLVTAPPTPAVPPLASAGLGERLGRAALFLAFATVLALGCSTALLALVFRADFLNGAAASVARLIFEHWAVAALLAASPLLAAMLVGYGYMQRAIRRRAAEAAAPRP
jgi:hypothetical protein